MKGNRSRRYLRGSAVIVLRNSPTYIKLHGGKKNTVDYLEIIHSRCTKLCLILLSLYGYPKHFDGNKATHNLISKAKTGIKACVSSLPFSKKKSIIMKMVYIFP